MSKEVKHFECDGGSYGNYGRIRYTAVSYGLDACPVCVLLQKTDAHETKIETLLDHVKRLNLACKDLLDAQVVREVFQNKAPVLTEGPG